MDLSDLTGAQDCFVCLANVFIAKCRHKQKRPGHRCG